MTKAFKIILLTIGVVIGVTGTGYISEWSKTAIKQNRDDLEKERILNTRGVRTIARIDSYKRILGNDHRPSRDINGVARYSINYSFEVGEKTYRGATAIPKNPPFDRLEIVYDPESPDHNGAPGELPVSELTLWHILHLYIPLWVILIAVYQNITRICRNGFGWNAE